MADLVQERVDGEGAGGPREGGEERLIVEDLGESRKRGPIEPLGDQRWGKVPGVWDAMVLEPPLDGGFLVGARERVELFL